MHSCLLIVWLSCVSGDHGDGARGGALCYCGEGRLISHHGVNIDQYTAACTNPKSVTQILKSNEKMVVM